MLIENKVFTKLHNDQISIYKKEFEEIYKNTDTDTKYVYITCHEEVPIEDYKICIDKDIVAWTLGDLQEIIISDIKDKDLLTGNDLFDEFWIRMWNPKLRTY